LSPYPNQTTATMTVMPNVESVSFRARLDNNLTEGKLKAKIREEMREGLIVVNSYSPYLVGRVLLWTED
jgi:hypothetical protein